MKRILSIVTAMIMLFCILGGISVGAETQRPVFFGDVDRNGVITSADYNALLHYISSRGAAEIDTELGDTDSDGTVDSTDLLQVQQVLLGISDSTPYVYTGLVVYPLYDSRIERDYEYDVTVTQNGVTKSLACYNHTDNVASTGRLVDGDSVRRFCEFAFDGMPVRVDITVKQDFDSYTVMPSAKNFKSSINGNVISVYLDRPEYFLLKLDDVDNSILTVFADEPEYDAPNYGDENVIYIDGWYETSGQSGTMVVDTPNTTLYIAPGAVLNCRVDLAASGVKLCGRGMILDPFSNIYDYDASQAQGHLLMVSHVDCTVRDIKLVDARCYNLTTRGNCQRLDAQNVKILSSEMCTDGISQWTGRGNSYKHCYIYVGDNAVVITDGTDCTFEDLTIGTICAALFPQGQVGTVEMNDIYVFRCDEGLMRNVYNGPEPATAQRTFTMTVNNINAVDCDHFPYIFVGRNMGTLNKRIVFNNIAVPVSTGSNTLGRGDGSEIRLENGTNYLYTDNYDIEFNGLSVNGKALTNASKLKVYNNQNSVNEITVTGNGAVDMPKSPNRVYAATVSPNKLFVGNRQIFTAAPVIEQGGTRYWPANELERALCFDIPDQYITYIEGNSYVTADALVQSGATASAYFDEQAQKLIVAPAVGRDDNLLEWGGNEIHSRWAESTPWLTHLVTRVSGTEYRLIGGSKNTGCQMRLTDQVRQYGTGTYRLTIDLRTQIDTKVNLTFGVNSVAQTHQADATSTDWTTVTVDFTVSETEVANAYIRILQTVDECYVRFKNAKLEYLA